MANLVARAIGGVRRRPRAAVTGGAALGLVAMVLVGLAFGPLRAPGGPGVSIGKDSAGAELKPHHSTDEVVTALRASLSADDRVVSISVARLIDFKAIAGDQPSGNGDDLLWYVRFAGPAPAFPPMAWGAGDSGWMVLDDASGRLRGAGGLGASFRQQTTRTRRRPSLPYQTGCLPYRRPTGWSPRTASAPEWALVRFYTAAPTTRMLPGSRATSAATCVAPRSCGLRATEHASARVWKF